MRDGAGGSSAPSALTPSPSPTASAARAGPSACPLCCWTRRQVSRGTCTRSQLHRATPAVGRSIPHLPCPSPSLHTPSLNCAWSPWKLRFQLLCTRPLPERATSPQCPVQCRRQQSDLDARPGAWQLHPHLQEGQERLKGQEGGRAPGGGSRWTGA